MIFTLQHGELLLLASNSPRRAELLKSASIPFRQCTSPFDEHAIKEKEPSKLVRLLAEGKSLAVNDETSLILTADTVVALENRIFGKPVTLTEAKEFLHLLSGRTHQVHTGVCLRKGLQKYSWVSTSLVTFKQLNDAEIDEYLSLVNPLDKAGAYAIQTNGEMIVASYSGYLSTIIGLPIEELCNHLIYK